jgi:uncharacterized protein YggE
MLRICGSLAILLLLGPPATAHEPAGTWQPSTIRVVAQASVAAKPDQADVDLGVTTDKKTATAATAENARKMEQVVEALKKEVGAGGEVKTLEFTVSPRLGESRRGETNPPILGYTVTNTVQVRIADIKAVGRLLDRAFLSGANTVERLEFTLKDPDAAESAALRAATAKARARAAAMADGLGLRVGQVLSVSEGDREEPTILGNVDFEKREKRRSAPPIEPGSVEVRATVTVVFALAPR